MRDVINESIDNAAPTVNLIKELGPRVVVTVEEMHVPSLSTKIPPSSAEPPDESLESMIKALAKTGMGPRKIAAELSKNGCPVEYYQIAYRLKKMNLKADSQPKELN